ncbi:MULTISPECIES: hypothetical protein [Pseudomonas fluorescens group]|uniref:hypothetical protein n=1 Tax=Pseudomonas fluorescens group TaxID=136843 RepID=UPI0013988798|nr:MULTISPECIES: hypothetical protein [Pseudomonas fluorescens group]MBP4000298.1 hypothetical protein [Pseudomonas koreensis]QIA04412.1 hypothetical protein GZH78_20385 [Pseudomonas fluorescens]
MSTFANDLAATPIGTYLRIWGNFQGANNLQCLQGNLVSVDVASGVAVLESTTYSNKLYNVPIDQISSIEGGHTGSGASGPVQTPDKVYNPVTREWQDKKYY